MQYYKNPENTDGEEILNALNIIHENVDHISEYRVIGGAPLMNRDWAKIVRSINEKNPEQNIFIYLMNTLITFQPFFLTNTQKNFLKTVKLFSKKQEITV